MPLQIRPIKEHLERYFLSGYQNAYLDNGLKSIRIRFEEFTTSPTRYIDLIRKMSPLFNVKTLRNEHAIQEGLYVVGRPRLCEKFTEILLHIVKQVELNCLTYEPKDGSIHGAAEKSRYKGKIILKFESMIEGIHKDYDRYAKIRQIQEKEAADQVSFITYMKSFPHLRNKTPLRWG